MEDLDRAQCTIEEREEYEPHLREGAVVFAGVDYEPILRAAEREADIVLWDGGNNDIPFYVPDLQFVVADPHRAGHELSYYPGETNFRMADVIVISKTDSAKPSDVESIEANAVRVNPRARVLRSALKVSVPDGDHLRGHRVLVVEDGPTLTHGGMAFGAATLAAESNGATIVDARRTAVGSLVQMYAAFPHLQRVLPAMGYSPEQVKELEETIRRSDAELVLDGSPVDLARLVHVPQPIVSVSYDFDDLGNAVTDILAKFLSSHPK